MSSFFDQPVRAHYHEGKVHVSMASGIEIALPIMENLRLQDKPSEQIDHIELFPLACTVAGS